MAIRKSDGATEQECPKQRQQNDLTRPGLNGETADQLGSNDHQQGKHENAGAGAHIQMPGSIVGPIAGLKKCCRSIHRNRPPVGSTAYAFPRRTRAADAHGDDRRDDCEILCCLICPV